MIWCFGSYYGGMDFFAESVTQRVGVWHVTICYIIRPRYGRIVVGGKKVLVEDCYTIRRVRSRILRKKKLSQNPTSHGVDFETFFFLPKSYLQCGRLR